MEMDDPWGSPWAEEVQIHPEVDLKPEGQHSRPTTPVRATTLALEEKTSSPWDDADDGGFGDWAATSAGDEGTPGFDGTEEWEESVPASFQLKEDIPSDVPWVKPAYVAAKDLSKLSPSLLPKSSTVRQPSLDPWASEVQGNDEDKATLDMVEKEIGIQEESEITAPIDTVEEDTDIPQPEDNTIFDSEVKEDGILAQLPREESLLGECITSNDVLKNDGMEEMSVHFEIPESPLVVAKPVRHSVISNTEALSSRLSSSPSEHSHHDENLLDSPRTSVDDEPKRAWVMRKVSSKVQGLVEHFDSLALHEEISESISVSTEHTLGTSDVPEPDIVCGNESHVFDEGQPPVDEDNDFGDFGDFEEGNFENEEQVPGPSESSAITDPKLKDRQERFAVAPKDLGPIAFDLDTTVLNEIYSDNDIEPCTDTIFIPDRDLDNTLSTIEQRKMWYRVSRYGTKRKHDNGDEENYTRVTWAHSQMRQDTLKIVARWMEEDRISGRVVLGGASKGSSVFGWTDMKAGPVPIAQAFAAKRGKKPEPLPPPEVPREWPKGLARSRSTSTSRSVSKPRRQSSAKSSSISEDVPASETPAPDFGWNSTTEPEQDAPTADKKETKVQSPPKNPRPSHRSASSSDLQSLSDLTAMFAPQTPIATKFPPPAPSTSDPWASVDFSFFDAPAPKASSIITTNPPIQPQPQNTSIIKPLKTVTFSNPLPNLVLSTPSTSKGTYKSREEIAQDAIVQSVIRDLPDLSYMFRR